MCATVADMLTKLFAHRDVIGASWLFARSDVLVLKIIPVVVSGQLYIVSISISVPICSSLEK